LLASGARKVAFQASGAGVGAGQRSGAAGTVSGLGARHRGELVRTTKDGLVTPYDQLEGTDRVAASPRSGDGDSVDRS
jgi:hypothetical protein